MTTKLTGTGTTRSPDGPTPCRSRDGLGARAIHHADVALRRARVPGSAGDHERPGPGWATSVVGGWAGTEPGGLAASPYDRRRSLRGRRGAGRDTPHPGQCPGDRGGAVGKRPAGCGRDLAAGRTRCEF